MSELPEFTIAELEGEPRFDVSAFERGDAVDLGLVAVEVIREEAANLAVQIVVDGAIVFVAKLGTTGVPHDPWLTGKAAVAEQFGESSLLVRLRHDAAGTPFKERADVDHDRLRAYGGSIPLFVDGDLVGTLTTSGEADVVDHAIAMKAIRRYLAH